MKHDFYYIASNPDKDQVKEMLNKLSAGYKLISAVSNGNGVQYILAWEEPNEKDT